MGTQKRTGQLAAVQTRRKCDPTREKRRRRTVLHRGLVVNSVTVLHKIHLFFASFLVKYTQYIHFIVYSTSQSRSAPICAAAPPFAQSRPVGHSTTAPEHSLETTIHPRSLLASTLLLPPFDRRRSLFRSHEIEGIRRKSSRI